MIYRTTDRVSDPKFHTFQVSGLIPCILCIMACFLFACGSDPEEDDALTPEENLQVGWEEYSSGNYEAAIQAFERVVADSNSSSSTTGDNSHWADAYNGLGWAYMSLSGDAVVNHKNIAVSLDKFQKAITLDSTNADVWIGKAGLLLVRRSSQDDLRDALNAINNALQGNTQYLYRHDYDSEADLYVLRTQCYYYLGELDKARSEIERVLAIEKHNTTALAMRSLLH